MLSEACNLDKFWFLVWIFYSEIYGLFLRNIQILPFGVHNCSLDPVIAFFSSESLTDTHITFLWF